MNSAQTKHTSKHIFYFTLIYPDTQTTLDKEKKTDFILNNL